MITKAITRAIPPSYPKCVSTHPQKGAIKIEKVIKQHQTYVNNLKELYLDVIELSPLPEYPDSCFVEDTAVVYDDKAMMCNFGAKSRIGEEKSIKPVLSEYFQIREVQSPATIEGGDVLQIGNKLIIGLTQRTNSQGVTLCEDWFNIKIETVKNSSIIHLKSFISYLDHETVLTTREYTEHPSLDNFFKIIVKEKDQYSANALSINGTIIIPMGYEDTKKILKANNFDVIELNTSEFQKCDGALTCLSILF